MKMPYFSVCVPTYNSASTIARCLTSIVDQTFGDYELVIVDDGSTDDTLNICRGMARQFCNVRIFRQRANVGLVGNHNSCIAVARGDWIKFVHADDWLLPYCLADMLPHTRVSGSVLVFSSRLIESDDDAWKSAFISIEQPLRPLAEQNEGTELVDRYIRAGAPGNCIGEPTSVAMRRTTTIDCGGFQQDLKQLLDMDLWLRIIVRGKVGWVERPLSVRAHTAMSATVKNRQEDSAWSDQLVMLRSLASDPELDSSMRWRLLVHWIRTIPTTARRNVRTGHPGRNLALLRLCIDTSQRRLDAKSFEGSRNSLIAEILPSA